MMASVSVLVVASRGGFDREEFVLLVNWILSLQDDGSSYSNAVWQKIINLLEKLPLDALSTPFLLMAPCHLWDLGTLVHLAAYLGHTRLISMLLLKGMNPHAPTET